MMPTIAMPELLVESAAATLSMWPSPESLISVAWAVFLAVAVFLVVVAVIELAHLATCKAGHRCSTGCEARARWKGEQP